MTNDDKDLKPCKICNKKHNEMQEYGIGPGNLSTWFVRICLNCGWQPEASKNEKKANEAWNTRSTPQQPSEPLKELDEEKVMEVICDLIDIEHMPCDKDCLMRGSPRELSKKICAKFGQPSEKKAVIDGIREVNKMTQEIFDAASEKKAVSVLDIARIIHKESGSVEPFERASTGEQDDAMATAQAIHSALPTQKALSVEDIKSIAIKATRKIKYPDGKTEYSLWLSNDEWTTIAQAIFDALPAQREVRYPEKEYCGKINTALHNDNCEECKYHKLRNKLIDKMKKLNGG